MTFYIHRTLCDTLDEMRNIIKHFNVSEEQKNIVSSLVEEAQTYASRMEAGLGDKHDLEENHKKKKALKADIEALTAERDELRVQVYLLTPEDEREDKREEWDEEDEEENE